MTGTSHQRLHYTRLYEGVVEHDRPDGLAPNASESAVGGAFARTTRATRSQALSLSTLNKAMCTSLAPLGMFLAVAPGRKPIKTFEGGVERRFRSVSDRFQDVGDLQICARQ